MDSKTAAGGVTINNGPPNFIHILIYGFERWTVIQSTYDDIVSFGDQFKLGHIGP
jgi:hypothetical protein